MKKALLCLILLLVLFPLNAQLETAHWYFGHNAGVDFTSGSPVAVTNGALYTREGCASISDKEGNLLFYTDGITVYDKTHEIMPNGTGLLGHISSTQSAIIIPHPYQPNIYYLFTVHTSDSSLNEKRGIHYSIVDITLDAGRGDIVSTHKNIPLPLNGQQKSDEKITAVKHANGRDVWVITRYIDSFYAFLINSGGVMTTPVISTVGIITKFNIRSDIGYMKASPNGKKIAAAYFYEALALYDFNNSSGIVSNEIILEESLGVYGVEFSPNSKILYGSTSTGSSHSMRYYISQYDLTAASIPNSKFTLTSDNIDESALQLALDKKIYYTNSNGSYLSVINNPNVYGTGADYQSNAVNLEGKYSRLGLPPFIVSFFDGNISVNGSLGISDICINKTVTFSLDTDIDPPYTIDWDFGDGTSVVNNPTPSQTYLALGVYTVIATVHYTGGSEVFTKEITISPIPIVNLGADITTCDTKPIVLDAGNPGSTYLWSTGETTQTIEVSTSGIYSVKVTNAAGCTGSDDIEVTFGSSLVIDLGADITTCDTKPIVLDADNAGSTYLWNTGATTQTIEVSTSGIYSVKVTNAAGCTGSDDIEVTFGSSLVIDLGADITTCDTKPIVLDADNAGSTYLWNTGATTQTIEVSASGIYSVKVTNAAGCTGSDEIEVTFSPELVVDLGTDITTCDTSVILDAGNAGSTYLWSTGATTQTIEVSALGIYSVKVTNAAGCTGSDEVEVTFSPELVVNLGTDITTCDTSVILDAGNAGSTYLWSTGATTQTIEVSASGTYSVKVTNADGCTDSDEVEVTFNPKLVVDLGTDITTCDTSVILDAGNAGSTYLWNTGATTQTIEVSASGIYSVKVTNTDGCTGSDEVEVTFNPKLVVDLGTDITTCDTSVILDAGNAGSTYLWNTDATTQTIEVSASGIYSVEVTNAAGCTGSDEIEVTFSPELVVNLGTDITTCDTSVILDAGNAGSTYLWNTGATTQTIEVSTSGTYSVEVTNADGCTGSDEIEVTFSPELVVDLGTDITTCDTSVILDAGNAGSTYLWNTGATTQTIEVSASGIYSVKVTNAAGCTGSDEIEVTFSPELVVDLGTDITTCEATAILDSKYSPLDATIVWTLADGTTQRGTQTLEAKQSGKYTVSITKEGCTTTDEVNVTLSAKPYIIEVKTKDNSAEIIAKGDRPLEYSLDAIHWQASPYFTGLDFGVHVAYVKNVYGCISDAFDFGLLNIPNIITPNGDGKNDAWDLKGLELYPGSKIQIFDRYGKLLVNTVFTQNPVWDGKYLNNPVPSTTYWYIIELTDGRKLNGAITVKNY